jgi:hypothetical protein
MSNTVTIDQLLRQAMSAMGTMSPHNDNRLLMLNMCNALHAVTIRLDTAMQVLKRVEWLQDDKCAWCGGEGTHTDECERAEFLAALAGPEVKPKSNLIAVPGGRA